MGGAVYGGATFTARNSTFTGNSATDSGGALAFNDDSPSLTVTSCIVAGNTAGLHAPDIFRQVTAGTLAVTNSVLGTADVVSYTGTGNATGTLAVPLDPQLLPLANNGGPTPTHALKNTSPAIGIGSNTLGLTTDQRGTGYPRLAGSAGDAGAVEYTGTAPTAATANATRVAAAGGLAYTFTVTYDSSAAANVAVSSVHGNVGAVQVTGPTGTPLAVVGANIDTNSDGKPRTVTYTVTPPGGAWDVGDNGVYTLSEVANQAKDTAGAFVGAGVLRKFQVTIPTTFVVTNTLDSGPGSLRDAVGRANANSSAADTVTFQPGLTGTITLATTIPIVTDSVTINGTGASVTVDGNGQVRALWFFNPGRLITVAVNDIAIAHANIAVRNAGESVTLTRVKLLDNAATEGAAIYQTHAGTTALTNCTLEGNKATYNGGAVFGLGYGYSTIDLTGCTLANNTAGENGGAVFLNGFLAVRNSTFAGNTAAMTGGAVFLDLATMNANQSTFAGNAAQRGGAIHLVSQYGNTVNANNCVVAGNTATGSGVDVWTPTPSLAAVTFNNSVIGVGDDFAFGGTGNASGTLTAPLDPLLGSLADNGGPTRTRLLLAGSPAIGLVGSSSTLTTDQRGTGYARLVGARVDAGATERAAAGPTATLLTAPRVFQAGGTGYSFSVFYDGYATALQAATLNGNLAAVTVTTPGGTTIPLTSAVIDTNTNGTSRTVTYTFTPPGGSWDVGDNGAYTLRVAAGQVLDTAAAAVPATTLGTFTAGILVVSTLNDSGPGSLRAAIAAANLTASTDETITFQPGLSGSIVLASALPTISDSVVIDAAGATVTVDGDKLYRPFTLNGTGTIDVGLANLTVRRGYFVGDGGAIYNSGERLTLTNVTVRDSEATGNGGGVYGTAGAAETVVNSTFLANISAASGGGLYHAGAGTVSVTGSSFLSNSAATGGGLATQGGTLDVANSTYAGNAAGTGGGIAVGAATATLRNVTVAGNTATTSGGGVALISTAKATLTNALIGDNTAPTGSDFNVVATATATATTSLLATTVGYTLAAGSTGNQLGVPTGLSLTPANNGGPTQTLALFPGSKAIDAGGATTLTTDQRGAGFLRVVGAAADIGAYEYIAPAKVTGVVINGGSIQRSVVSTIQVNFSAPVTATGSLATAITVTPQGGGAAVPASVTLTNGGLSALLTFPTLPLGSLADGFWTVTVFGSQLASNGMAVDGDGNGTPGGNATAGLFRYLGDADGDGAVDGNDLAALAQAFNSVVGDSNYRWWLDLDGDGAIDGNDLAVVAQRFNTVL